MAEPPQSTSSRRPSGGAEGAPAGSGKSDGSPKRRGKGRLVLFLLGGTMLLGGGATAGLYFTVPAVQSAIQGVFAKGGAPARVQQPGPLAAKGAGATGGAVFHELPEMTVTLTNAGRPRQMRVKLVLEITRPEQDVEGGIAGLIGPRIQDSLVLYLRTLRDAEIEGAVSVDRIRGDLYRRLDLLLGPGVLRDVLVTSLVVS